jgi:hypothetical protein
MAKDTTGTYSEKLPCGGELIVGAHTWHIKYYFAGPDLRYNGEFVEVLGRTIDEYISAYEESFQAFENLKQSISAGGEYQKSSKMGLTIRVGNFNEGVCVAGYHMPICRRAELDKLLSGYRYAASRARGAMELLARLGSGTEPESRLSRVAG